MPGICQKCGEALRNGFYCGCGLNEEAVRAFGFKAGRGTVASSPSGEVDEVSPGEEEVADESQIETTPSQADQVGVEVASVESQVADLKAEVKRIEGEIDALFKQRQATSSLEWYRNAIDQFNNYNDPDASSGFRGPSLHLFAWAFFGFLWIPIGYAWWLMRRSERAAWDLGAARAANRKVNDQIKGHRNRRTALLDELNASKARLKELAGKDYHPDWRDDPADAATVALGGAVRDTTSGVGRILKGVIGSVPVGTCPNCKENWAKEHEGENTLKTDFLPASSTASKQDRAGRLKVGHPVVIRKVTHYEDKYRCKRCSHRWAVKKKRETRLRDVCPHCYQPETKKWLRTEKVGITDHMGSEVVRDAIHLDQNDKLVGSTLRQVQVPLRTVHYERHFCCRACGQEWTQASSETSRV